MTRNLTWKEASRRKPLPYTEGNLVQVKLDTNRRCGTYVGLIRKITPKYVTIQRPSDPDATSRNTQFRGEVIRVRRSDVRAVVKRGKVILLEELGE